MYFGVHFGDQRGFVFCTGRRRSQIYRNSCTAVWVPGKGFSPCEKAHIAYIRENNSRTIYVL